MAITGPMPPMGAPQSPVDLSGLAAMFGSVTRDAAADAMVEKLRPALRLISELESLLEKTPEIQQVVQAIVDARLGKKGRGKKEAMPGAQQSPPMPGIGGAGGAIAGPLGALPGMGAPVPGVPRFGGF